MNRKEAAELLPIIQAFAEGETIQVRDHTDQCGMWEDVVDLKINTDFEEYRIKPKNKEAKYRPFANTEESWKEMFNHKPFGWIKDKVDNRRILITSVDSGVWGNSLNGNKGWSMEGLMRNFTFADGTPFGVKVEE